jgi:hypothetical protein
VAGEDYVLRLAVPLIRKPRMSGAPGSTKKRIEKLRYMHRNPLKRGL